MALHKLSGEVEAALRAKSDVNQDNIGVQRINFLQSLRDRRRRADDIQPVALEAGTSGGQKPFVVIDNEAALNHPLSMTSASVPDIPASRNP